MRNVIKNTMTIALTVGDRGSSLGVITGTNASARGDIFELSCVSAIGWGLRRATHLSVHRGPGLLIVHRGPGLLIVIVGK